MNSMPTQLKLKKKSPIILYFTHKLINHLSKDVNRKKRDINFHGVLKRKENISRKRQTLASHLIWLCSCFFFSFICFFLFLLVDSPH
jgi:cell division septal protein FtsQ